MEYLLIYINICIIDIILSGDNAIIIAMACKNLPKEIRFNAAVYGTLIAIALRIILTVFIAYLLNVPLIQFFGGLLLIIISFKILRDSNINIKKGINNKLDTLSVGDNYNISDNLKSNNSSMWGAIKTIVLADLVMSLDNVLAIAGIANGNIIILVAGLSVSIPFIILGSGLLMKLMDKFPILIMWGAFTVAMTAGNMMLKDAIIGPVILNSIPAANIIFPGIICSFILIYYLYDLFKKHKLSHSYKNN